MPICPYCKSGHDDPERCPFCGKAPPPASEYESAGRRCGDFGITCMQISRAAVVLGIIAISLLGLIALLRGDDPFMFTYCFIGVFVGIGNWFALGLAIRYGSGED